MNANFRCLIQMIVLACGCLSWLSPLWAQNTPPEFLETAWRLDSNDSRSGGLQEGESRLRSHSGETSYRFSFIGQLGNEIIAQTEVAPCHMIRELEPSLHVYCQQTGVQIMARVVLPETESPSGNGPMYCWIRGNSCSQAQRWTKLDFSGRDNQSLYSRFGEHLPVLRRQYGSHVSDRNAFVDRIAVSLGSNAGLQEVFLDSLQIDGAVSATGVLTSSGQRNTQVGYQQSQESRPSLYRVDETVIMQGNQPFVIRAIQYNGEPMSALRQLGFNTVWMSSPPTIAQLQLAKDNGLMLIAPPPIEQGLTEIDYRYDSVLAWLVGDEVNWADQAVVKQRIDLVHQVDVREGRPTLVRARTGLADYSRAADIVCVGKQVIGTSFPLYRYSDYLKQRTQLAQTMLPMIAEIDTEIPLELEQQVEAFSDVKAPLMVQPQQLRGMCFQAIAGGARGFLFRSRNRLDDTNPVTQQRRLSLRWVNQQIDQLYPWIAGGAVVDSPESQMDSTGRIRALIYAIKTSRSRLLLIEQLTGLESYTAGWSTPEILNITNAGGGVAAQPYRMTPTGLVPATHRSSGHQMQLQLENPSDWEVVVETEDPQVVRYVEQESPGAENIVVTMEQAEVTADLVDRLARAMVQANRDQPEVRESLNQILSLQQSLAPMATSDDPLAYWNQTLMFQREVAAVQYRILQEAQQPHTWPTASPLTVTPLSVPLHWQSVTRLSNVQWSPNGLPGGDFENLEHTIRSGWRHHSSGGNTVASAANLDENAAVEGRRGLSLTAFNASGIPAVAVEHVPIWIDSAPVSIPANHLVRIAGHVRIDQPIVGSIDGVTIQDSLGGEALQQRVLVTSNWQPFVIYRATNEPHQLQLSLSLTGLGTVLFDELTVQMAPIPEGNGQPMRQLDLPGGAIPPTDLNGTPATPVANQPLREPYAIER